MSAQNASGNTALHICALYNQVSGMHIPHPNPGAHWTLGGETGQGISVTLTCCLTENQRLVKL